MSDLRPIIAGALSGGLTFLVLEFSLGGTALTASDLVASGPNHMTQVAATTDGQADADLARPMGRDTELSMGLAALQVEVDGLRDALSRLDQRRLVAADIALTDPDPTVPETGFGAQRDLVLQVMDEERDREEAERSDRRSERALDRAATTADRLAEELGLDGADRDTLAEILTNDVGRQEAMMDEIGDVDWGDQTARQDMRDRIGEVREVTRGEIESRLGSRVAEAWGDRGRGGFGGFDGPGGFGRRGGRGSD